MRNELVLDFARDLIGFLSDAVNSLGFQAGKLRHLLQSLEVVLGPAQMVWKPAWALSVPSAKPAHPCSAISAREPR